MQNGMEVVKLDPGNADVAERLAYLMLELGEHREGDLVDDDGRQTRRRLGQPDLAQPAFGFLEQQGGVRVAEGATGLAEEEAHAGPFGHHGNGFAA